MTKQIENRLCPFCGGNDCVKSTGDGFPLIPNCLFEAKSYAEVVDRYNVRPLEDALQAKLDRAFSELTALVNVIEFDDILTELQIIEILKSVIAELEATNDTL